MLKVDSCAGLTSQENNNHNAMQPVSLFLELLMTEQLLPEPPPARYDITVPSSGLEPPYCLRMDSIRRPEHKVPQGKK